MGLSDGWRLENGAETVSGCCKDMGWGGDGRKGSLCCTGAAGAIWRGENVEREPAYLALAIPMTDVECVLWLLLAAQNKHCKREEVQELLSLQAEGGGHRQSPEQSSSKRFSRNNF